MNVARDLLVLLGLSERQATAAPPGPGWRLPPVVYLARRLKVSTARIREELTELAERGLVARGPGRRWWSAGVEAPPAAREAADKLTYAIALGRWGSGEQLPPEDRLAEELGTSERAVYVAELLLATRGLLRHSGTAPSPIVALSRLEFALLRLLGQTPGQCVAQEALIRDLWPDPEGGGDRLKVLVGHVRGKLGRAVPITTFRGRGYGIVFVSRERQRLVKAYALVLNPATGLAREGISELRLSRDQFSVLLYLAKNAGWVVSRSDLVGVLRDRPRDNHTLAAIVQELDRKLEAHHIEIHGSRGYSLVAGGPR